ncbi:hypothetical protein AJ85_06615 [Alkalihalobacillus alcalophilus ATCC 27647 = CGMCC 1.3604]|uniref:Uncharacterized protein n=1 Tax=Alkalihalobacillus alcalophilus ATCC 27647 = CGMCC 1.3604 TaxID=1218173 RepID=A0A094WJ63_ALKAL|nr:hypothetical protein [Alkalihalobacillus alcalophilus]YP_009276854.1 hypothetical protein BH791_gp48 [Bacillus phage BalMu-1]AJA42426.1 hypothetical protein BalMu1_B48 [Bacillus phage BalMu-1]AJA42482.1 hypothetical protein BalMu1_A48 [Bacillus phage BalMu-1]KGA96876.1 hypothetical protein BALCAV_0213760 [Alkalihalobacillus alcalophilus ATCC 27647 = CGMCC 1.3604]MED1561168.1 hypothetical protein [Alkalihalobacillus alcalophilus]THG91157.1 hypothetical protein AJ85_06615 [Alkalihalobacillus
MRTFFRDHIVDEVTEEVLQEGTPLSANVLNNGEERTEEALQIGMSSVQEILQLKRHKENAEVEIKQVTLNNSQAYPFNNSRVTVALGKEKVNLSYEVHCEVLSSSGGEVGELKVTDKQVNGFKVEFTGSASQVVIRYFVRGGMK